MTRTTIRSTVPDEYPRGTSQAVVRTINPCTATRPRTATAAGGGILFGLLSHHILSSSLPPSALGFCPPLHQSHGCNKLPPFFVFQRTQVHLNAPDTRLCDSFATTVTRFKRHPHGSSKQHPKDDHRPLFFIAVSPGAMYYHLSAVPHLTARKKMASA